MTVTHVHRAENAEPAEDFVFQEKNLRELCDLRVMYVRGGSPGSVRA